MPEGMTPLQAATQTRQRFAHEADKILQDRTLSPVGKREKLNELHRATQETFRTLRQEHETAKAAERRRLEQAAFGMPDQRDATGYRDALARADGLKTQQEAAAMLRRADRTGDSDMAQAIVTIASERGWSGVLTDFGELYPDRAGALIELQAYAMGETNAARKFEERVAFSTPSLPSVPTDSAAGAE